jgi:hypothetical protein
LYIIHANNARIFLRPDAIRRNRSPFGTLNEQPPTLRIKKMWISNKIAVIIRFQKNRGIAEDPDFSRLYLLVFHHDDSTAEAGRRTVPLERPRGTAIL